MLVDLDGSTALAGGALRAQRAPEAARTEGHRRLAVIGRVSPFGQVTVGVVVDGEVVQGEPARHRRASAGSV